MKLKSMLIKKYPYIVPIGYADSSIVMLYDKGYIVYTALSYSQIYLNKYDFYKGHIVERRVSNKVQTMNISENGRYVAITETHDNTAYIILDLEDYTSSRCQLVIDTTKGLKREILHVAVNNNGEVCVITKRDNTCNIIIIKNNIDILIDDDGDHKYDNFEIVKMTDYVVVVKYMMKNSNGKPVYIFKVFSLLTGESLFTYISEYKSITITMYDASGDLFIIIPIKTIIIKISKSVVTTNTLEKEIIFTTSFVNIVDDDIYFTNNGNTSGVIYVLDKTSLTLIKKWSGQLLSFSDYYTDVGHQWISNNMITVYNRRNDLSLYRITLED